MIQREKSTPVSTVCTILTAVQHTTQYGHVSESLFQSSYTVCAWHNMVWGRIYRVGEILLSCKVSLQSATFKKVRVYFCQASLMAHYFQLKSMLQCRFKPLLCLFSSQVVHCVQSVQNTAVQWFPTRYTERNSCFQAKTSNVNYHFIYVSCNQINHVFRAEKLANSIQKFS